METKFNKFEEQVFLTTTLIENLTDKETGTGFIVIKPAPNDQIKILLFSNKHVFWGKKDKDNLEARKQLKFTFHKKEADGTFKLGQINTFAMEIDRKKEGYFDHPDSNIDVACLNVSDAANKGISLNIIGLNTNDFFNINRSDLYAGQRVLFIGYPTGFYDKKNFLPIMRSGTIGSIPSVDFEGKKQILLDAQVSPGSSGSPVFILVNSKYNLLGIISSGVHKGIDFVQIDTINEEPKKSSIPREWIGLGLLFTNETIKEVYDLA